MIYGVILCIGDSLTYGARDEFGRSYPLELSKMISAELQQEWVCINKGNTRDTTSDLLRRIYDDSHKYSEASTILLWVGTNDLKVSNSKELFEDNYRQLIRNCLITGKKLIIGTIPPFQQFGMPAFSKKSQAVRLEYNNIIREIAEEKQLSLVEFDIPQLTEYLIDGIHFTNAGNKEIAKLWLNKLRSL